jgi:hypothetical protein
MASEDLMSDRAVIANGASLSGEVDLRGLRLLGVIIPSAWTAADLSFQVGDASGGTFGEAFLDAGNGTGAALALDAAANQASLFNTARLISNCFIKVRSGPVGVPVNQGAARTITILTEPL